MDCCIKSQSRITIFINLVQNTNLKCHAYKVEHATAYKIICLGYTPMYYECLVHVLIEIFLRFPQKLLFYQESLKMAVELQDHQNFGDGKSFGVNLIKCIHLIKKES